MARAAAAPRGRLTRPPPRRAVTQKDINKYYGLFCRIDLDGSGEVSLREFYTAFDLGACASRARVAPAASARSPPRRDRADPSPFSNRVFTIMGAPCSRAARAAAARSRSAAQTRTSLAPLISASL